MTKKHYSFGLMASIHFFPITEVQSREQCPALTDIHGHFPLSPFPLSLKIEMKLNNSSKPPWCVPNYGLLHTYVRQWASSVHSIYDWGIAILVRLGSRPFLYPMAILDQVIGHICMLGNALKLWIGDILIMGRLVQVIPLSWTYWVRQQATHHLSRGTFSPLGRFVRGTKRFVLGRFVLGRFVLGRFALGRLVLGCFVFASN